ncbi:MAG: DUF3368 domain-containing protein [Clostridiales bacterium]|nr:DUF3368 domain-containing protein [Clostridiales bacterium]
MIKVICNASPIIGLMGIEKLSLLWELFDEVVMPEAVFQEICAGKRKFDTSLIKNAIDAGHIKVIKIRSKDMTSLLYGKLHAGELETIVGAKEDPDIRFAIIDEKAARTFAAAMLVDTLGILGILRYAKNKGKIKDIRPYLDRLIQNNYRISDGLYYQVLEKENEL